MLRIEEDKLEEIEGPGETRYLWDHKPFTGIAYTLGPDDEPWIEVEYQNSFKSGFYREWYAGGKQLRNEGYWCNSDKDAFHRTWAENGQITGELVYEYNILVKETRWDESGKLIYDYEITVADPLFYALEKKRRKTKV